MEILGISLLEIIVSVLFLSSAGIYFSSMFNISADYGGFWSRYQVVPDSIFV